MINLLPNSMLAMTIMLSLLACAGPEGSVGPQGVTGLKGSPGPQGPSGTNGTDSTITTVVQLCPVTDPTIPGVFPETGLCIDGKLYAVFNQPNKTDYLVLIPPGTYESMATGASCTFTVYSNCSLVPPPALVGWGT